MTIFDKLTLRGEQLKKDVSINKNLILKDMATKLDLADAQFIGFCHGKDQSLIAMIESMGLTKSEWIKWKTEYTNVYLSEHEIKEIDEYFKSLVLSK